LKFLFKGGNKLCKIRSTINALSFQEISLQVFLIAAFDLYCFLAMSAFLAFSFYSSGAVLLDVRQPKEGILRSLASIRFISMTWVAAGHTIGTASLSEALLPMLSLWNPLLSTTFTNAFLSVDTFFLLSGILVAYLFFKSRPTSGFVKNPMTWTLYYVHRYLRLTPPIMIFIWFFVVFLPFTNGPWSASVGGGIGVVERDVRLCQQHWWRNMLYINNFFNISEDCYGITWYLAVDTQLYMVAPIFLVALYISPLFGEVLYSFNTWISIYFAIPTAVAFSQFSTLATASISEPLK
uniref:Acyl_transf_3 domain-containing protein n=1 Tax=Angiostrongylus cantonensis TaxID=6313 RepID=A0A158P6E4_ANGCA